VLTSRIPSRKDHAAIVGVSFKRMNQVSQLVHTLASIVSVHVDILGPKVAPLEPIHGTEIALLTIGEADPIEVLAGRIAVPDLDPLILKGLGAGVAADEPKELLCHPPPEDFFGRQQGKFFSQVKPHLASEFGNRSDPWAWKVRKEGEEGRLGRKVRKEGVEGRLGRKVRKEGEKGSAGTCSIGFFISCFNNIFNKFQILEFLVLSR